jgi:hypothetical protein
MSSYPYYPPNTWRAVGPGWVPQGRNVLPPIRTPHWQWDRVYHLGATEGRFQGPIGPKVGAPRVRGPR